MTGIAWHLVDLTWFWTTVLGVAVSVGVFALGLRKSDWAPLLAMTTVPIQRALLIGDGSMHVTYTQAAVLAFFGSALILFLGGHLAVRIDLVSILLIVVLCLYGLSIVVGPNIHRWIAELYRWFVPVSFFVIARTYFRPSSVRRLLLALSAMIGVAGVWSLAQIVSDSGPTSFQRNGVMRVYGGFGEPNPFAAFVVAVTLPLIVVAAFGSSSRRFRLVTAAIGATGVGVVLLTQSRGGLLSLVAGVGTIALVSALRKSVGVGIGTIAVMAVGSAIVVLGIVFAAPWQRFDDGVTVANWAERERQAHWSAALAMVRSHPVFGVGAGAFSGHFRDSTTDWRFRVSRGHAHNAYLQVAAEAGLPAALAYCGFMSVVGATLLRRVRDVYRVVSLAVLAVTVALGVHQLFDYLNVLSLGLIYSGLWAAALCNCHEVLNSGEYDVAN